jgi:hypothetical protein
MTYMFKLARRTARLRSVGRQAAPLPVRGRGTESPTYLVLLTSLLLSAACGPDVGGPTSPDTDPEMTALETPTTPAGATSVSISPGQSIQAKVNAYPGGTQFLIKSGTHIRQTVKPKSGNVFIGEAGAVLDGQNATAFAFDGTSRPYPSNVRIKGLTIQNYKSPALMGAIQAGRPLDQPGDPDQVTGWVIDNCEIRNNAAAGVRVGHKTKVINNNIHHNLQLGISGNGDSVLIENNELAYNNYTKMYKMDWAAGGAKLVKTRWLIARGNHVHHNWGFGLWTDVKNSNVLYEGNLSEDNASAGIMHEISYSAIIRNNTVRRNGFARDWVVGAGILVSASSDVQVYGNTVSGNKQGIVAIQQDRVVNGVDFTKNLKNLYVHNNTVTITSDMGRSGIASGTGDIAVWTNRNNRFQSNVYYLTQAGSRPFVWKDGPATVAGWKSYQQDTNGTFHQ